MRVFMYRTVKLFLIMGGVSDHKTMSRIIKQDFGLGAFKQKTGERLTIALKEGRNKIKTPVVVQ
jgi:hypothetical protein